METLQNTGAVRPPKANKKNINQEANNSGYNNLILYRVHLCDFLLIFKYFRENALGRLLEIKEDIKIDAAYGFRRVTDSKERIGFLLNMHAVRKFENNDIYNQQKNNDTYISCA